MINTSYLQKKDRKEGYYITLVVVLLSIRLWSFTLIPKEVNNFLELVLCGVMTWLTIKGWGRIRERKMLFKSNALIFIIPIPIISIIAAYIYHDQSFFHSAVVLRSFLFWQLYFILHLYNVSYKDILKIMLLAGIIWALLNILQQFTYPVYYFANREEDEITGKTILRAGVYRFTPFEYLYGLFVGLYFFYKFLQNRQTKHFIYFLVILVSFYFYGTRQNAAAFVVCCVLMVIFLGDVGTKLLVGMVIALIGCVLFYFRTELFGGFIELTQNETNEDYIRILAADFYWNEYWPPDMLSRVIGNGRSTINSEYGKEVFQIEENYKFFTSDVGLIGAYNTYGVLYILNIVGLNIKAFSLKYYHKSDRWIYFNFIAIALVLIMIEGYYRTSMIPFFCILFYLVDLSYQKRCFNNDLSSKNPR